MRGTSPWSFTDEVLAVFEKTSRLLVEGRKQPGRASLVPARPGYADNARDAEAVADVLALTRRLEYHSRCR